MLQWIVRFSVLLVGMMAITATVLIVAEGVHLWKAIGLSAITATLKSLWAVLHHRLFPSITVAEEIVEECL